MKISNPGGGGNENYESRGVPATGSIVNHGRFLSPRRSRAALGFLKNVLGQAAPRHQGNQEAYLRPSIVHRAISRQNGRNNTRSGWNSTFEHLSHWFFVVRDVDTKIIKPPEAGVPAWCPDSWLEVDRAKSR